MFLDCPWNSSSSLGQQHNSYHFISDDNSHHRIKQFRFLQKESSSSCIVSPAILWANIQTFLKNISQRTNKSVLWDTYLYKNVKNAGFALVWLRLLPPRMASIEQAHLCSCFVRQFDALFMLRSSILMSNLHGAPTLPHTQGMRPLPETALREGMRYGGGSNLHFP